MLSFLKDCWKLDWIEIKGAILCPGSSVWNLAVLKSICTNLELCACSETLSDTQNDPDICTLATQASLPDWDHCNLDLNVLYFWTEGKYIYI